MSFLKTTAIQHLNASTPAINLDANGNIGIGTTSPNKDPGVTRAVTLNGTTNIVEFCVSDSRVGWVYSDNSLLAVSAGGARTCRLETNGYPRLSIDSSGRVTLPYQPHIRGSISRSTQSEGVGNLFYQRSAIGLSFSTDRITVPVAGVYMITWMTIAESNTGRYDANLLINGSTICSALNEDNGAGFHQKTVSISANLSASDYIQFYNQRWYSVNSDPQMWSTLSVTLLG